MKFSELGSQLTLTLRKYNPLLQSHWRLWIQSQWQTHFSPFFSFLRAQCRPGAYPAKRLRRAGDRSTTILNNVSPRNPLY